MTVTKIISGDTHIVEPPDLYTSRMSGKLRTRAPYLKRQKTPEGKESDAWFLNDFPHSESTWLRSREFLANMLTGVPEEEVRKLTCDNREGKERSSVAFLP